MIRRRRRANESIEHHAVYLGEHGTAEVAERFLDAVEESLAAIDRAPGMGREWSRDEFPGVRFWPVKGFPNYLLFYTAIPGGVELLRLYHAKQNIAGEF